jgi:hypothetical protein
MCLLTVDALENHVLPVADYGIYTEHALLRAEHRYISCRTNVQSSYQI